MSTVEFKGLVLAHKPREKHYLIMACSVFYQLCSLYLFFANIFQNREIPASLFLDVRLKNGFSVSIETQVSVQRFTSRNKVFTFTLPELVQLRPKSIYFSLMTDKVYFKTGCANFQNKARAPII